VRCQNNTVADWFVDSMWLFAKRYDWSAHCVFVSEKM